MKLIRAKFENFRLLRDLEIHFSTDRDKKLTVLRGANESGKTTILYALQWALYGDSALPGGGKDFFRLQPLDWNNSEGVRVPITVTVDFEVNVSLPTMTEKKLPDGKRKYRIIRSVYEEAGSHSRRSPPTAKLFELTDTGALPIENPESRIDAELPPQLREIFFIDGDRALSFIEADLSKSIKRERVTAAIKSLLGLEIIDSAIGHARKSAGDVNRKAKQIGGGELDQVASHLESLDKAIENVENNIQDAKQQFALFEEKIQRLDKEIGFALEKGDREQLKNDIQRAEVLINKLNKEMESASREHSDLFRSEKLGNDLLREPLQGVYQQLEVMRDQGKIPNTTIPILEDRLAAGTCICGETLKEEDSNGRKRRDNIQTLIDESRQADNIQTIITSLYFGTRPQQENTPDHLWTVEYKKVVGSRLDLQNRRNQAGTDLRSLETKLAEVPDTNIQELRGAKSDSQEQRDRFLGIRIENETKLTGLVNEKADYTRKMNLLLKEERKGSQIIAESEIIQDVIQILEKSYEKIANDEMLEVSNRMNSIFLEMIGADAEQNSVINRAEINSEFDIVVLDKKNQHLNPDRDLNGSSRRALTLAFILALTQVSEVVAPNVIDTPLGMMSDFVRTSVFNLTIRESTQLVLFLTNAEIYGCESIIDQYAGKQYTLTNAAHYPGMLVNNPGANDQRIIACGCSYKEVCNICQRKQQTDIDQLSISAGGGDG